MKAMRAATSTITLVNEEEKTEATEGQHRQDEEICAQPMFRQTVTLTAIGSQTALLAARSMQSLGWLLEALCLPRCINASVEDSLAVEVRHPPM
eukprot:411104-Amphidinium_carterae.1